MKKNQLLLPILIAAVAFSCRSAFAQLSTPPATTAEMEATYTTAIESRTEDILKSLSLTDTAKSNQLHDAIIAQYRVMRARDVVINARLSGEGKAISYATRASQLQAESKELHEQFFTRLATILTPEQVETVKDKMTYGKVKVTYDAYCTIVPGLNDAEKAKILELLKAAREEAVDGGSAPEKSDIFQKYKTQINAYLDANGHDTAKAIKEWEAKQVAAKQASDTPQ
jgi:Spy/CpxP family protein refolding chaperone